MERLKKKKSKSLKRIAFFGVLFSFLFTVIAYAAAPDAIYYQKNAAIFKNASITMSAFRELMWGITKLFIWFSEQCNELYNTAFGFIDWTNNPKINDFVIMFRPILLGLIVISLVWLGIILIVQHEKKPKLHINIVIFVLVMTSSTYIFSTLNTLAVDFKNGIGASQTSSSKEIYDIVNANTVDLVSLGTKTGKYGTLNNLDYEKNHQSYYGGNITKKNLEIFDYTEVLNPQSDKYDWDKNSIDILSNKSILNVDGVPGKTVEVYNGLGWNSNDDSDIANEFYYRYTVNNVVIWIQLGALIVLYLALSYKTLRILFELISSKLFLNLYSTELAGGEKVRKILEFILNSYILLGVTIITPKLYSILTSLLAGSVSSSLVKAIFSLFIAFCVIDGPNIVEKILGMDAGLKSSTARMLGIFAAMRTARDTGRDISNLGKKAADTVFGEKSAKSPMPQDGKRHGGIRGAFTGENDKAKDLGKSEYEDRLARAGINDKDSSKVKSDNEEDKNNSSAFDEELSKTDDDTSSSASSFDEEMKSDGLSAFNTPGSSFDNEMTESNDNITSSGSFDNNADSNESFDSQVSSSGGSASERRNSFDDQIFSDNSGKSDGKSSFNENVLKPDNIGKNDRTSFDNQVSSSGGNAPVGRNSFSEQTTLDNSGKSDGKSSFNENVSKPDNIGKNDRTSFDNQKSNNERKANNSLNQSTFESTIDKLKEREKKNGK